MNVEQLVPFLERWEVKLHYFLHNGANDIMSLVTKVCVLCSDKGQAVKEVWAEDVSNEG